MIDKIRTKEYYTNKTLKEELLKEFDKIDTDFLEPEFPLDKRNPFIKVIDENLKAPEDFNGLLP